MDIPALLSSVSTLTHLSGLLVKERDSQKAAAIQIDFTNKLMEMQTKLSEVLGTVIEQQRLVPVLEQRIRELEAQAAEKGRYVLAKVGTEREFFAYRSRPVAELDEGSAEVEHFLCQPCFDSGKKVVMNSNGDGYWHCPGCRHGAQVQETSPIARRAARRETFSRGI